MSAPDNLLSNQETAEMLGIKPTTLEIWRHRGKGPVFVKFGDKGQSPVRYRRSEVTRWIEAQSFASTSAYSPAGQTSGKSHNSTPPRALA